MKNEESLNMKRTVITNYLRTRRSLAVPALFFILHSSFFIQTGRADDGILKRQGDKLELTFNIAVGADGIASDDAVVYTPCLCGAAGDTTRLPAVAIYGRKRYVYLQRNGLLPLTGSDEIALRARQAPDVYTYNTSLPYERWMQDCQLVLNKRTLSCCNDVQQDESTLIAALEPYRPVFPFVQPADVQQVAKTRSLSGEALVTFPVSQTTIYDTYMQNAAELEKIHLSIDSVRDDPDVTINRITIKGYASPESSYANNERLSKGRTEALADYVASRYGIARSLIATDNEPENWQGLTDYIRQHDIPHASHILALIRTVSDPDQREAQIKRQYPQQYAQLLKDCYPALRKSDYRIDYTLRAYTDPAEIRRLVDTRPQNLSLPEFYLAAQDYTPGSPDFCHVYEVAVRLFPDDPTCNLNAACSAMQRGDLNGARPFLERAGNSPQADEARNIYKKMKNEE